MDKKFRVAEIFGPTIQGEGSLLGEQTYFIRLGGCDYRCVWCDSPQAVDPEQVARLSQLTVDQMVLAIDALPGQAEWVTISGGNPALFDLMELIDKLHLKEYKVAVETQASIWKDWFIWCDCLTLSPKPPSSGNMTEIGNVGKILLRSAPATQKIAIKVVVFDERDLAYAASVFDYFREWTSMRYVEKWVQVGNPEFMPDTPVDKNDLLNRLRWLGERVIQLPAFKGVRVTPQMHTLMWGNQRGK